MVFTQAAFDAFVAASRSMAGRRVLVPLFLTRRGAALGRQQFWGLVKRYALFVSDRVLTTSLEHEGGVLCWRWLAERRGVALDVVELDPDDIDPRVIVETSSPLGASRNVDCHSPASTKASPPKPSCRPCPRLARWARCNWWVCTTSSA